MIVLRLVQFFGPFSFPFLFTTQKLSNIISDGGFWRSVAVRITGRHCGDEESGVERQVMRGPADN